MKRLTTVILSALLILTVFAFTSCDQEAVDGILDNLINTGKDLLDPFFRVAESSGDTNDSSDADVNPDTESSVDDTNENNSDTENEETTRPEDENTEGGTTDIKLPEDTIDVGVAEE